MKILKNYSFEILLLVVVSITLGYQDWQSETGIRLDRFLITMMFVSFFLFLLRYLALKFIKLYEMLASSYANLDIAKLGLVGRLIIGLIFGGLTTLVMAGASMFSIFLLMSSNRPTHVGLPFAFYPLEGDFRLVPFIADVVIYAIILELSKPLREK